MPFKQKPKLMKVSRMKTVAPVYFFINEMRGSKKVKFLDVRAPSVLETQIQVLVVLYGRVYARFCWHTPVFGRNKPCNAIFHTRVVRLQHLLIPVK